jgi:hypothetical protein
VSTFIASRPETRNQAELTTFDSFRPNARRIQ